MSTSAVSQDDGNDHNPKRCRRIQDVGTLLAEGEDQIPRRNACAAADRGKDGAHKYLRESVIFFSDELPLEGLPPGTYTLEVKATDHSRAS